MRKINLVCLVVVMTWGLLLSGCLTPRGNRFGQSLVRDYARASVIRDAENRNDRQYDARGNVVPAIRMMLWDGDSSRNPYNLYGDCGGVVNVLNMGLYIDLNIPQPGVAVYTLLNSNNKIISQHKGKNMAFFIYKKSTHPNGDYVVHVRYGKLSLSRAFRIIGSTTP
jgi:hypothetical protein